MPYANQYQSIVGDANAPVAGIQAVVEQLFGSLRTAVKPLDYLQGGATVLGHYSVCQQSGAIAATPTALDTHASFRWAPTNQNALCVPIRIKIGWQCISAIATAVRMVYSATIARSWTTADSSGTFANLGAVTKTGAMRTSMGSSLLGTSGPQIAATGAITAGTRTLDADAFAMAVMPALTNVSATGTAVQVNAGGGVPMSVMYEWTGLGQHPIVLANNEGVVIRIVNTGWAAGTVSLNVQWEWAELYAF